MLKNSAKMKLTAWFVCSIGAIFYAYEYLLRIAPSAMEIPLRHHFALTATGFGLLSSIYYYAYVPMQVPVGILMDRFGPRRLLTLACFTCAAGAFIFSSTNMFNVAICGRLIVGIGSAFAYVGVLKLATIWFPENKLAMIAGLTAALGTIGAMIGDNVMDKIIMLSGWQQTIIWIGIIGLILTVIIWFSIHDHKRDLESGGTIDTFKRNMYDLIIILKTKQMWLNGLFGCLIYLPTTVFAELWGIPYLENAHGLSASDAGFANSLVFCGFMIGAPLMGYISDKLSRRVLPMTIGSIGAAIIMLVILYVPIPSIKLLNICMFVLGLLYSCQAIVFAIGRELSPNEAAGTAFAVTNMLVMLGAMFLQPLVGKMLDYSFISRTPPAVLEGLSKQNVSLLYSAADYKFAISIIPIGIVIAAILTFFIKETYAEANN
ncbi:MAG: MFS transporter [Legionellales bacterium RIFCSPHIGHO2_12_FULL_35_11]|nr:MAG: MFS transporter [Legionellales bacterium RIFCSPHIGHO2_12_FULL_35_11]